MVQIAILGCSIGLIVLGIKSLVTGELAFSKKKTLSGGVAKAVGVACILGGVALVPLFFVTIKAFSN